MTVEDEPAGIPRAAANEPRSVPSARDFFSPRNADLDTDAGVVEASRVADVPELPLTVGFASPRRADLDTDAEEVEAKALRDTDGRGVSSEGELFPGRSADLETEADVDADVKLESMLSGKGIRAVSLVDVLVSALKAERDTDAEGTDARTLPEGYSGGMSRACDSDAHVSVE